VIRGASAASASGRKPIRYGSGTLLRFGFPDCRKKSRVGDPTHLPMRLALFEESRQPSLLSAQAMTLESADSRIQDPPAGRVPRRAPAASFPNLRIGGTLFRKTTHGPACFRCPNGLEEPQRLIMPKSGQSMPGFESPRRASQRPLTAHMPVEERRTPSSDKHPPRGPPASRMDVIAGKRKSHARSMAYHARHDMPPGQGDSSFDSPGFLDQGPIIGGLEAMPPSRSRVTRLRVGARREPRSPAPLSVTDPDRRIPRQPHAAASRSSRRDAGIKRVARSGLFI